MSKKLRQSMKETPKSATAPLSMNVTEKQKTQKLLEKQKRARVMEKKSTPNPKIINFKWKFKNTKVERPSVGISINKLFNLEQNQRYNVEVKILSGFNSTGKNDGRRGHDAYLHFDKILKKENNVTEITQEDSEVDAQKYCLILEPASDLQYINRTYSTTVKGGVKKRKLSMRLTFTNGGGPLDKRSNFIDFNENCISVSIQLKVKKV